MGRVVRGKWGALAREVGVRMNGGKLIRKVLVVGGRSELMPTIVVYGRTKDWRGRRSHVTNKSPLLFFSRGRFTKDPLVAEKDRLLVWMI